MTTTIAQKDPIKGTREFQLVGDEVQYSIDSPIKTESLSVVLNVLDPEPVISGSMFAFVSQVNREPLVELFLDNPDKESFDRFVETMRRRITEEDFSRVRATDKGVTVDVEQVGESIEMLRTYVDPAEIETFLSALEELMTRPDDPKSLSNVADAFNDLGFMQAQVITYAPYINFLLSENSELPSL